MKKLIEVYYGDCKYCGYREYRIYVNGYRQLTKRFQSYISFRRNIETKFYEINDYTCEKCFLINVSFY